MAQRRAPLLLTDETSRQQAMVVMAKELQARGVTLPRPSTLRQPFPSGYFPRMDKAPYVPNEVQGAFITDTARYSAIFGGRGSGKTASGVQKALAKIRQGLSGVVIAPDFEQFRFSTWPELQRWIPWDLVIRTHRYRRNASFEPRSNFTIVFVNGAKMYCKGLKDPEAARGPNVNWLWYDEGGRDRTGLAWTIAIAGVRIGKDPQAWVTTTPKGKHHWLYKFFVEKEISDEVSKLLADSGFTGQLTAYHHVTIEQNKHNLDPVFYASLVAAYQGLGHLREQELEGLFVEPGGALADRNWVKIIHQAPVDVEMRVRYWDLAATLKQAGGGDPDFTAGGLASWSFIGLCVEDIKAGQMRWRDVKKMIVSTALMDGPEVPIFIEQEGGASGKAIVDEIQQEFEEDPFLMQFTVTGDHPVGDKLTRAQPWIALAANGRVSFVAGKWNDEALNQMEDVGSNMGHDDYADCISGAAKCLGLVSLEDVGFEVVKAQERWAVGLKLTHSREDDNGHEPQVDAGARWRVGGNHGSRP